jgi:hypothetical protein
MWLKNPAFKAAVSVVMSAMMAFPVPALAKFGNDTQEPAATDGPPVILEEVVIDGQTATFAVVPYTAEQEAELVDKLARVNPDGLHLGVAGDQDPALKAASKTGFLKRIKAYVVGDEDQLPFMRGLAKLSAGSRERLKAKMKALTAACKESKVGLVSAISYSGILGTSVWMTSSSVPAGAAILSVISAWNAFILLKPEIWGAMIRKGANVGQKIAEAIGNYYGTEISDVDKRVFELVGKFAVTTAVGAVQVALIRSFEGEMGFMSRGWEGAFEDLAYITFHAIKNNYSIWDDVVIEKFREGKVSRKGVRNYLATQYIVGGMLELGAYQHSVWSTWVLIGLTFSGVIYQILNLDQREKLTSAPQRLNFALRNGFIKVANRRRELVTRRIGSINKNRTNGCERLLMEDTQ